MTESQALGRRDAGAAVACLLLGVPDRPSLAEAEQGLRRALLDPTLRLLVWRDGGYVDAGGAPADAPADGAGAVTTPIAYADRPVAALVHHPDVLEEPEVLEAVCAAVRLALDRDRTIDELRASRRRLVETADAERRRLERNLHDGVQQRLVVLRLNVRLARARLAADDPAAAALLAAEEELRAAIGELRELARGLHPGIIGEQGLERALRGLLDRVPLPVAAELALAGRAPEAVEAAAYYVVSEAVTNALKHAEASALAVDVRADGARLVAEVSDDGVGGVRLEADGGLRGLVDRVEALGGTLRVESPRGHGTLVGAEIPY